MKVKDPHATCGPLTGANYRHLGHFAKSEHVNRGHNVDVRGFLGMGPKKSLMEQTQEAAERQRAAPAPAPSAPSPAPSVPRRSQQIEDELKRQGG